MIVMPVHLHTGSTCCVQLASAIETLRANGQRITEPRRAVLNILTHEHGPFTAEELHRRLTAGECDLVTVYRVIAALEDLNLVRRCDFGDGAYRYEFNTGEKHHHHIICRSCQSVEVLDECMVESLESLARQKGYANVTHTLEIFGVCAKCQKRTKGTSL
jgi:Fur family ferric uptake transcriptional regulator